MPPDVFLEIITTPSTKEEKPKNVSTIKNHDWRAEIMGYLRGHYEPQDELENKKTKAKGKGLCRGRWRIVQVQNHRTMAKMYNIRERSVALPAKQ
jgi:hypothetical protein